MRFGYQFLGPFLVDWYNRLAVATVERSDDSIYMLGREGWNLVPLFNSIEAMRMGKHRRYIYLPTSRALLTHISLSDPELFYYGFNVRFNGTIRQFLESRLCLHVDLLDISPSLDQFIILPRDSAFLVELIGKSRGLVEAFAKKSRDAYGAYLQTSGFRSNQSHLISDLGFRGTTQALITAIYGYQITGFYAMLDPASVPEAPPLSAGSTVGLFSDDKSFGQGYIPLDRSLLLEAFLTAPFGQVSGIQPNLQGDPFLYREGNSSQRNFGMIAECIQGAHKFALDHRDLLGSDCPLIVDFVQFFEAYQDAIAADIRLFRPILALDDSYFGVDLSNAEEKL